jgi:hypothetical protein
MAIKLHASFAVHPGEWLRAEIVAPAGLSVTALAERLHVTRQTASNLLNGNAGDPLRKGIRAQDGHVDAHAGGARTRAGEGAGAGGRDRGGGGLAKAVGGMLAECALHVSFR